LGLSVRVGVAHQFSFVVSLRSVVEPSLIMDLQEVALFERRPLSAAKVFGFEFEKWVCNGTSRLKLALFALWGAPDA
jgi:hypothetical protein